ncbi:MAG: hypothetical protein U1E36_08595 [Rickettsiales bacterium]
MAQETLIRWEHPALDSVRYKGNEPLTKCGILPFHIDAFGQFSFLLHIPKPKIALDETRWGIARGTIECYDKKGAKYELRTEKDIMAAEMFGALPEPAERTVFREAEEELGLKETDFMLPLYDCGILAHPKYGIHFLMGQVKNRISEDALTALAVDSKRVGWFTVESFNAAREQQALNGKYITLFYAMTQAARETLGKKPFQPFSKI